ncbi:efflux RND transporter periplasmic adaptor subunit [Deinococcus puniceus]|uniref:RND transporter n=1 Tax=Deinococcus puniceus TaxID=1182568 RepID=A0A172T6Y2_9DEIO|nr:HlyD family efflux transporter periplasmic adaptor subunit [Deinococcus puniceus]ANE42573.1 RND transporter [Deinococcus puniceus]
MVEKRLPLALTVLTLTLLVACTPPGGNTAAAEGEAKPAAAATGTGTSNDLDAAPAKTTTLGVRVVPAKSGTLSVERTSSATIQADRDSNVAAQSGGNVVRVLVTEGEQVRAGQVVVQLDDSQQRQALENARLQVQQAQINLNQTRTTTGQATTSLNAAVQAAQATLSQAQQNAQSSESLYALGGISLADLQSARAQLATAQSQLAQARNSLSQNGQNAQGSVPLQQAQLSSAQAGVRQADENLSRTAVRAPFAGTVASLNVQVGEFAGQGSTVFRLVDPGSIKVQFNATTADAAALTAGTQLNLGYGGVNYVATVQDSPRIAGADRLVPITARVQGGAALPVGASAQARYRATLGQGVLIPSGAVQVDGGENAVYLAEGKSARRQTVTVVAESGGQVAVRGLDAGAQVISPVPPSLQDGASIRVETAATPTTTAGSSTGEAP